MGKKKKKTVVKDTAPVNEVKTDIKLTIEEEAYICMMTYAHLFSPTECSGTGLVERVDYDDGSVEFNVKKVFLPNQKNSGAYTDIPEEEMAKLNCQLAMDGEDTSLHKFHWHSHVDMGVFHSGTDDGNYDDMQTGDYAVSLVVNKRYEMLGSVHLYAPLRINVLNIEIEPPDIDLKNYAIPDDLMSVLKANVDKVHAYEEEHKPTIIYPTRHYGQGNVGNGYGYGYPGYDDGFGAFQDSIEIGVSSWDDEFNALLQQGEKQGLIVLFKDKWGIVGYRNCKTGDYFHLGTEYVHEHSVSPAEMKKDKSLIERVNEEALMEGGE